MDAIQYLKERDRMCETYYPSCDNCPFLSKPTDPHSTDMCVQNFDVDPGKLVSIVEKWSREHPVMANAQKFKEVFGFNAIGDNFTLIPVLTPHSYTLQPKAMNKISDWKSWWQKPYKEPEDRA